MKKAMSYELRASGSKKEHLTKSLEARSALLEACLFLCLY